MAATDPIISIFFNLAYVGIFALGYFLMEGITINDTSALANEVSGIVVVSQYSMQIMQSFIMLAFVLVLLPQTMASMSRINEVLKCEDTAKINPKRKGKIGKRRIKRCNEEKRI